MRYMNLIRVSQIELLVFIKENYSNNSTIQTNIKLLLQLFNVEARSDFSSTRFYGVKGKMFSKVWMLCFAISI